MRRTGDNVPHMPGVTDAALLFTSLSEAVGASPVTAQPAPGGGGRFEAIWLVPRGKKWLREKGSRSDAVTEMQIQ